MIEDQLNDPNISPYQETYIYQQLVIILQSIRGDVLANMMTPTLADQFLQYIMTTWSEALYYYQSTYFVFQARMWTAYQGGDPSIWDGILLPQMRDRNGFN